MSMKSEQQTSISFTTEFFKNIKVCISLGPSLLDTVSTYYKIFLYMFPMGSTAKNS